MSVGLPREARQVEDCVSRSPYRKTTHHQPRQCAPLAYTSLNFNYSLFAVLSGHSIVTTDNQAAADVMMIRPASFAANPLTASSNRFQQTGNDATLQRDRQSACQEFEDLVAALRGAGVRVHVFDDTPEPSKPDAVFPNNWVSFHADGTAVLYPMMAENRRLERRMDLLETLDLRHGFRIARTIDLSPREADGKFLEGTGSLVLDRVNRVAYACLSPRTDMDVLGEFAQRLDYDIVAFEANDVSGVPIYHTNVVMSVGKRFAAVCSDAIESSRRAAVTQSLRANGHEVIELSYGQLHAFAGNMLELQAADGATCVAMSQTALQSLSAQQRQQIEACSGRIVSAAIPTIERLGGGSVRCMLAEVHLPRRAGELA